ncbi:hypothetical protein GUJ93_ZPchr0011g27251 [Zizania palustris]|uniref:Uncharacterized protein n=1 Tax=Zizania palustris TaxID=103762 RepID=A0A8J6BRS8_ZIZPA|nr:hypothetical protein GUJ93_ZPchr0011g27251 [Zizania palustris]
MLKQLFANRTTIFWSTGNCALQYAFMPCIFVREICSGAIKLSDICFFDISYVYGMWLRSLIVIYTVSTVLKTVSGALLDTTKALKDSGLDVTKGSVAAH